MSGYNYYNPDLDKENNADLYDFEKIMTDPEEGRKAMRALRRGTTAKNTITLTEFEEFKELFMHDSRERMGNLEYDELCLQWKSRVSIFHPVKIITDDRSTLLLTLPPIFSRPVPVNVIGSIGPELVMAFHNACSTRIDTFNHKKQRYAELTKKAYTTAQELVRPQNIKETELILEKFRSINNNNPTGSDDEKPDFSQGEVKYL